ncbi:hypothetical protein F4680DRAFT_427824 [Xylaria scruposa]|nr:hypothetical protein F4680DRAFT_427824 [Xylaria scruposa]
MSDPLAPSTNGYGEVIGNGHQTVDLVSSIFQLVGSPLNAALTRRNAHIALRKGLGEWAGEAFDKNNHCQQPLLREDAFVIHLIENQATFHPRGSCNATFAWAKLLYSLDIRPGNNIIEWQPLGTDADPSKSGTIELALEGPVLCHIVNLYQIYDDPYGASLEYLHNKGVTWKFPFGALNIHPEDNGRQDSNAVETWAATFKPYSGEALSAPRQPFLTTLILDVDWSGRPLAFQADSIAIKYVSTAKHSMCSDGVLGLPDPMDTIQTRCISLYKCFETLRSPSAKPYLITPSWIEQANRIKRRMTTNGGVDDGLADYMVDFLSETPDLVEEMIGIMNWGNKGPTNTDWDAAVRRAVRELAFYENDTFSFYWGSRDVSHQHSVLDVVIRELPKALNSLSQRSSKTWLRPLSGMVSEVMKILIYREIEFCPVLVLGLTSDHPLWRSTCYIQGEVPTR